MGLLHNRKAYK